MEGRRAMMVDAIGKPKGCKLLRISVDISEPLDKKSSVRSISIRGDFFASPEEVFEMAEKKLAGISLIDLPAQFDFLMETMHIQAIGITGEGIRETIMRAIDAISM
jgi:hypothetical protein